jgi:hypothetical protein
VERALADRVVRIDGTNTWALPALSTSSWSATSKPTPPFIRDDRVEMIVVGYQAGDDGEPHWHADVTEYELVVGARSALRDRHRRDTGSRPATWGDPRARLRAPRVRGRRGVTVVPSHAEDPRSLCAGVRRADRAVRGVGWHEGHDRRHRIRRLVTGAASRGSATRSCASTSIAARRADCARRAAVPRAGCRSSCAPASPRELRDHEQDRGRDGGSALSILAVGTPPKGEKST